MTDHKQTLPNRVHVHRDDWTHSGQLLCYPAGDDTKDWPEYVLNKPDAMSEAGWTPMKRLIGMTEHALEAVEQSKQSIELADKALTSAERAQDAHAALLDKYEALLADKADQVADVRNAALEDVVKRFEKEAEIIITERGHYDRETNVTELCESDESILEWLEEQVDEIRALKTKEPNDVL